MATGTISTVNIGSFPNWTRGSFLALPGVVGVSSVTIEIDGSGTGVFQVWISTSGIRADLLPAANITSVEGTSGAPTGAGTYSIPCFASGTVYLVAASLSGSVNALLSSGPASGSSPAGSVPSNTTIVGPLGQQTPASAVAVISLDHGSVITVPPAGFPAAAWTPSSSPALPAYICALWITSSGAIYFDGGGSVNVAMTGVQGTWLKLPPGINISQIYATTTAGIGFAVS
jgi:hypothetical protein